MTPEQRSKEDEIWMQGYLQAQRGMVQDILESMSDTDRDETIAYLLVRWPNKNACALRDTARAQVKTLLKAAQSVWRQHPGPCVCDVCRAVEELKAAGVEP